MEAREIIKKVISEQGSSVLLNKTTLYGILSDYHIDECFSASHLEVLKQMCSEGDVVKLTRLKKNSSKSEFEIRNIFQKYTDTRGRKEAVVDKVLMEISIAIGLVTSSEQWGKLLPMQQPSVAAPQVVSKVDSQSVNWFQLLNQGTKQPFQLPLWFIPVSFGALAVIVCIIAISLGPHFIISGQDSVLPIGPDGHPEKFEVKSNRDFTCETDCEWLRASCDANSIRISADSNKTSNARDAIMSIHYGKKQKTYTIRQRSFCTEIDVEGDYIEVPSSSGKYKMLYSADAPNLTVRCLSSWCTVTADEEKLYISWEKNADSEERTAEIKLMADDISRIIEIKQDGKNSASYVEEEAAPITGRISDVEYNNWAINEDGFRSLSVSCNISLKNFREDAEVYAVLQPYIEKRPMNVRWKSYAFEGFCASMFKIQQQKQKIVCTLPYYAMEYFDDWKSVYAQICLYEKVGNQYKLLDDGKRNTIDRPDTYFKKMWTVSDVECDGKLSYAVHCRFAINKHKGDQFQCLFILSNPETFETISYVERILECTYKYCEWEDLTQYFYKGPLLQKAKAAGLTTVLVRVDINSLSGESMSSSNIIEMQL